MDLPIQSSVTRWCWPDAFMVGSPRPPIVAEDGSGRVSEHLFEQPAVRLDPPLIALAPTRQASRAAASPDTRPARAPAAAGPRSMGRKGQGPRPTPKVRREGLVSSPEPPPLQLRHGRTERLA